MRFTLHYSGPLRANGRPEHKHDLRRAFHVQLAELWRHEPLSGMRNLLLPPDSPDRRRGETVCTIQARGPFTFAPLVASELRFVAAVEIVMLRPERPGRLVVQGGDMDNRLKTLFDAMSVPQFGGLPPGAQPAVDEAPFYCVLEDDSLITSVAVHTEHLLTPQQDRCHVELVIRVDVTATARIWATMPLV
jgi:hypothetical protein